MQVFRAQCCRSLVLGVIALTALVVASPALAQANSDALGVAHPILSSYFSTPPADGTIISLKEGTYTLSSEPYDKNMFGVIAQNPAIQLTYEGGDSAGTIPVISTGQTLVRVSAANGPIIQGDRITSSEVPGVGMKASKSGFSLGIAEGSFTPDAGEQEALIPVTLQLQFTFASDTPASEKISSRLVDVISLSSLAAIENPITALQYTTAAGIIIASLIFSFVTFGKVARDSVRAIGRNPLATKAITVGLIWNGILACAVLGIAAIVARFMVML